MAGFTDALVSSQEADKAKTDPKVLVIVSFSRGRSFSLLLRPARSMPARNVADGMPLVGLFVCRMMLHRLFGPCWRRHRLELTCVHHPVGRYVLRSCYERLHRQGQQRQSYTCHCLVMSIGDVRAVRWRRHCLCLVPRHRTQWCVVDVASWSS